VSGRRIFDGDALHSVTVLDFEHKEGDDPKLRTVARNFGPLWPSALGAWSDDTVIGANVCFIFLSL
jgi:DNA damage-binding protein 1